MPIEGWASLPSAVLPDETPDQGPDAVVVDAARFFDASEPEWVRGTDAVHEVGHWLGLLHTFRGGCLGEGDYIDDTPASRVTTVCRTTLDSCPDRPGNDPVTNYMSYSYE